MNGSQASLSIGKENGCIVEGPWENFQFSKKISFVCHSDRNEFAEGKK